MASERTLLGRLRHRRPRVARVRTRVATHAGAGGIGPDSRGRRRWTVAVRPCSNKSSGPKSTLEQVRRARSVPPCVALDHAGPTLIACGTAEQKARHLSRIVQGESIWCQGFSEPNAGSDLGALKTKGIVDGGDLVIEGHRIWSTSRISPTIRSF